MAAVVMVIAMGLGGFKFKKSERLNHAVAGSTILLCGLSIAFL